MLSNVPQTAGRRRGGDVGKLCCPHFPPQFSHSGAVLTPKASMQGSDNGNAALFHRDVVAEPAGAAVEWDQTLPWRCP